MSRRRLPVCVVQRLSRWQRRHDGDWTAEDFERFFEREREFLADARARWAAIVERFGRRLLDEPEKIPLDDLGEAVQRLDWIRATVRDIAAGEVLRAELSNGNVVPFRGARGLRIVVDEGPRLPPTG
jgi:hypothetical protein